MADEKLPLHLQQKEQELQLALARLRDAYVVATTASEQLKDTLQNAKRVLDENNY